MPAAAPEPSTIEFPDLTDHPTPLSKAVRLLQVAAGIEHALMIQYLYAGYAFSPQPNRHIVSIAMEEMAHLMTVQNLLRLVGADPYLDRQDLGPPDSDEERLFPFDLFLEPVTHESLAKYVVAESPKEVPAGIDPAIIERIVAVATQGAGGAVNRVGSLYGLLGVVFGLEEFLLHKAATGDPWYVMVNALAAEAAAKYGGRDKIHLPDSAFISTSKDAQGSDRDWDRSVIQPGGLDEIRVHVMVGREAALEALRDIGLQGEGPSPVATEKEHFVRFLNLYKEFYGADVTGIGPAPASAAVPRAGVIVVDAQSADPQAISNPDSVLWAQLANHRYAILLGSLDLYLRQPHEDRSFLVGWCFAEMFAIKKLAGILIRKPRTAQAGPEVAAVPFTLPTWMHRAVTWADLEAEFTRAMQVTALITATVEGGAQKLLLGHFASADARKLAEVQARRAGTTARRKSDRAREILDWAAGAADPNHSGHSPSFPNQSQGRFWNLPIEEFKLTEIGGANIVKPPDTGGDAPLIWMLRQGFMPRNRPRLEDPELQFLVNWVDDNCPDDLV